MSAGTLRSLLFLAVLCAMVAGCAGTPADPADPSAPAERAARSDAGADEGYDDFPPGAPQDCITVREIRTVDPVGNHSLLFYMDGREVWRSRLRSRCAGLRRNSVISYEVRNSRLCAGDIVHLLEDFGGNLSRGGSCVLGEFDYLTEDQAEAFKSYQ